MADAKQTSSEAAESEESEEESEKEASDQVVDPRAKPVLTERSPDKRRGRSSKRKKESKKRDRSKSKHKRRRTEKDRDRKDTAEKDRDRKDTAEKGRDRKDTTEKDRDRKDTADDRRPAKAKRADLGARRPKTPPRGPPSHASSGREKCSVCGQMVTNRRSGQEQHRKSNLLCLTWQAWQQLGEEAKQQPHAWQSCERRAGKQQRKYMNWSSENEAEPVEDAADLPERRPKRAQSRKSRPASSSRRAPTGKKPGKGTKQKKAAPVAISSSPSVVRRPKKKKRETSSGSSSADPPPRRSRKQRGRAIYVQVG